MGFFVVPLPSHNALRKYVPKRTGRVRNTQFLKRKQNQMLIKTTVAISCFIVLPSIFFTPHTQEESTTANTGNEWTLEKRAEYAKRNDDPSHWDMPMLQQDLEAKNSNTWPTNAAISDYPSPVADYDWGYCALGNLKVTIAGKRLKGKTIGYASGKYREIEDEGCYYNRYFNILYLTDKLETEAGASHIVSRNYPHYLSTGKQKTSMGEIDWVQMHRADGDNFAIVNQRYFDLHFGRTLLVIPHKDGSLRMLQLDHCPTSISRDQFAEETRKQLETFYLALKNDKRVVEALSDPNVIAQPAKK